MKRALVWLALIALGGTALGALTAWPLLNEVETGRTPEYPDLRVRTYSATPNRVGDALREALTDRPGWTVVGSGRGPGGVVVSAVHETPLLRFKDDVTVTVRRKGGRTTVSVRSRSRIGAWDFGQNARNVRDLLQALDAELR
jgi:uncharacterized protein (DUF1499 family)